MSANPLAAVIFFVLGYMWKNLLGAALTATFTGIDLDSLRSIIGLSDLWGKMSA